VIYMFKNRFTPASLVSAYFLLLNKKIYVQTSIRPNSYMQTF